MGLSRSGTDLALRDRGGAFWEGWSYPEGRGFTEGWSCPREWDLLGRAPLYRGWSYHKGQGLLAEGRARLLGRGGFVPQEEQILRMELILGMGRARRFTSPERSVSRSVGPGPPSKSPNWPITRAWSS